MASRWRLPISRCGTLISALESKALHRHGANSPFKLQTRNLVDSVSKTVSKIFSRSPKEISESTKLNPEGIFGEKVLYAGSSSFTVRSMFTAGCVNMLYWTHHLVNCIVYKDVIVQGIDLGGQPYWTALGYLGTVLIFYCNREYATHAAHSVYESADGKRIGFQMYNMVGLPGRRIEAAIGNVRLANTANWNLGSDSFVPLRIVGISNNVLLDKDGLFYADGRLKELLKAGGNGQPGSKKQIVDKDPTHKGTWAHAKSQQKKDQRKYLKEN